MTTLKHRPYKRKNDSKFDVKRHCAVCKQNGLRKKYYFAVTKTRKAKVCVECINKFKNKGIDLDKWLIENVIFSHPNKYGTIIGFKRDE